MKALKSHLHKNWFLIWNKKLTLMGYSIKIEILLEIITNIYIQKQSIQYWLSESS